MKLYPHSSPLNSLSNAAKIIEISAAEPEKWCFESVLLTTIETEKNEVKKCNIKSLATGSYVYHKSMKFGRWQP